MVVVTVVGDSCKVVVMVRVVEDDVGDDRRVVNGGYLVG